MKNETNLSSSGHFLFIQVLSIVVIVGTDTTGFVEIGVAIEATAVALVSHYPILNFVIFFFIISLASHFLFFSFLSFLGRI